MAALHWLAWARLADFANLVLYVVLFCVRAAYLGDPHGHLWEEG